MKILIADDELITRAFLKRMLEKLGHDVVECEDGEQAWQHMSSDSPPRLCILDWMMPKHSGPELCYSARALPRGGSFYLILLTSKSNKADIVEGLNSGANDYIVKPFNKDELKARIDVGIRTLELRQDLEKEHDQLLQLSKLAALTALAFANQNAEKSQTHRLSLTKMVKQGVDYCQNSIFKSEVLNIKVTNHVADAFVECKGNTLPQVILTLILNSLEALQRHPTHNLEISISEQGEKVEVSFKEPTVKPSIVPKFESPLLETESPNSPLVLSKTIIEKHGGEFIEVQDKNSTHYVMRLPKAA